MDKEEIYYWIKIFGKYQQSFRSGDGKEISFCKILKTLDQLQTNWNELKKFINSGYYDSYIYSSTILNKMQELEGKSE